MIQKIIAFLKSLFNANKNQQDKIEVQTNTSNNSDSNVSSMGIKMEKLTLYNMNYHY